MKDSYYKRVHCLSHCKRFPSCGYGAVAGPATESRLPLPRQRDLLCFVTLEDTRWKELLKFCLGLFQKDLDMIGRLHDFQAQ